MTAENREYGCQLEIALLTNDEIGRAFIEVENTNGIVILSGLIDSEQHRSTVETLVRDQKGVVDVINELLVYPL